MIILQKVPIISPIFLTVVLIFYLIMVELGNKKIKKILRPLIIILLLVFLIIAIVEIVATYKGL